jgi:hypothetical protein
LFIKLLIDFFRQTLYSSFPDLNLIGISDSFDQLRVLPHPELVPDRRDVGLLRIVEAERLAIVSNRINLFL